MKPSARARLVTFSPHARAHRATTPCRCWPISAENGECSRPSADGGQPYLSTSSSAWGANARHIHRASLAVVATYSVLHQSISKKAESRAHGDEVMMTNQSALRLSAPPPGSRANTAQRHARRDVAKISSNSCHRHASARYAQRQVARHSI